MASSLALARTAFAEDPVVTNPLPEPGPAPAKPAASAAGSKLATQTEIVAGQNQAPMLGAGSAEAMLGAIALYEEIVWGGGWDELEEVSLKKGSRGEAVLALRERLVKENYLPFDSLQAENASRYDDEMVEAVKAFQVNHGVVPSGIVAQKTLAQLNVPAEVRLDSLRENLPRVRAYAAGLGDFSILVNIPATQLETVEYGRVYSRHNIVVGKLERPSPSFVSKVSDINFNPYWKIPASIIARDIVPKYLEDPSYLKVNHIRVFDGVEGPEIDPTLIDWTMTDPERYFFRQEPGPHNSLGSVKINFPNDYMVYMHDTPHRELFGRNVRFESSGCVRIDEVQTVVKWILDRTTAPLDPLSYERLITSTDQFDQTIEDGPDVRWMYLTAWVTEDGRVNFRPDVYNLDGTDFIMGQPESSTY